MNAAHRNGRQADPADFWLGKWLVSPGLNQIRRNGTRIDLQNLSMRVLVYLAERQGEVVSKDELVENLWRGRVVGDDAVHRRIADLRRQLGDDRHDPQFIQTITKKGYRLIAPVRFVAAPKRRAWRLAAALVVLPAAVVAVAAFLKPGADMPEPVVLQPVADPVARVAIETSPPGAMIYYKPYDDTTADWKPVGVSPLETELPRATLRLRFVADGYRPVVMAVPNPSMVFNNVDRDFYTVELPLAADMPEDMVYVPAVETMVPLLGFYRPANLGRFLIARTEVSNRQYAEFVADGGYQDPGHWQAIDDPAFDFSQVAERFVDTTGRPGPAYWADGTYPPGSEELPVTGVSWYEAMAYASYRGMALPSARHWARAALGIDESRWPLAPSVLAKANIDSSSTKPVGDDSAMSTWGAVNLVGNVREWTTTRDGETKLTLGLGFASQQWRYALPVTSQPTQRSPEQGFRLVKYIDEVPDPPLGRADTKPEIPRVSDEDYASYVEMLAYERDPSIGQTATIEYTRQDHDWIRQRVVIVSDALEEPLPLLIFRPGVAIEPIQPILYLPPGDSYTGNFPSEDIDITKYDIQFVVESGRALVWPVIVGTHDRFSPRPRRNLGELIERWTEGRKVRRTEIGAAIDFLESQSDYDADSIGLLAASFGATYVSPSILATEDRIRSAVLISSALAAIDPAVFPAFVNPNTYWPRLDTPVMLLNGSHDISIHATESRDLLLQTIGSSGDVKRGIIYDAPHWPLPAHRVRADALAWFDRYLGPVQ